MQMRRTIPQRFVVQFPGAEDAPDCSSNLGHFGQVSIPCGPIQIVQFMNTGFREKETRAAEVLVGVKPDVSRG
jgi:hypothetical protein